MEGWTKEEEAALQLAHIEVKPCEDFWLQIAKKVPGRTAKECFDRYFSAYPTPPQQQPRAARRLLSSPVRVLTDDAFCSDGDIPQGKKRKQRSRKPTASASRKILRKIMREHHSADQDDNADAFAASEGSKPVETRMPLAVIDANKRACRPVKEKGRVGWEGLTQSEAGSPEVLRRTVNQDQLDRYLDVLHTQKSQDRVRAKNRSRRPEGTAKKSTKKPGKDFPSVSSAKCAIVSTAEEALRKCFKLKAHHSDAIDHTFDEVSSDADGDLDD